MKTLNRCLCLGLLQSVIAAAAVFLPWSNAEAAVIATRQSESGDFELRCETAPYSGSTPTIAPEFGPPNDSGLELNRMNRLLVTLTGREGLPLTDARLTLDAQLPAYELGMVVRPQITELSPGRFLVEGVKLHMAGEWELRFSVARLGTMQQLVVPVRPLGG